MKNNITIKDIARELNIHHVTVSRGLRNVDSVKKETRDLIRKKASELGYKPNRLAQNFRNKRSNAIGVLVPEIEHHFFSKFISDFTKRANDAGFSVMVFQSREKLHIEKKIIDLLISYHIAGVIASITLETSSGNHFDLLKDENIPYIFFDRVPENVNVSHVMVNNFKGAYDATTMMIKSGRKRIAYISTPSLLNVFRDRFEGYKQALLDGNLPYREELVTYGGFSMEDGFDQARMLMELSEKPDGILTVRDEVGIGAIKFLKKAGIRVPEEIAIIGFDNDPMGIACEPELTTVQQSISKMAMYSFELLLRQIDDPSVSFETKIIVPEIIQRGSS